MTTPLLAVGDTVDEVRFTVEAGKVREFAAATATTDPVHLDEDRAAARGLEALPATATHVMVVGHHRDQTAMVRALGLTLERVMVGSVRWRYHRPLLVGDTLHGVRRLIDDVTKPRLRALTLRTEFTDDDGDLAVTLDEVVLERAGGTA
jgi:acyl dehydratase